MAELFPSSTEMGLPTLTPAPSVTAGTYSFGLNANLFNFYISPVPTNEFSIYQTEQITPQQNWQNLHPTLTPFVKHDLPPPPKDLLELIDLQKQQQTQPQQQKLQPQQWPHQKEPSEQGWSQMPPSESSIIASPSTNNHSSSPMDIDAEQQPLPRPIPTRRYNYRSQSRESSVQSDASDRRRKLSQSSSTNSPGKKGKKCISDDERAERRKKGNTESQARSRQHNKVIKDLYEENDALIKEISDAYLSRGRSDPLICQLLKQYQSLPKKQRPYKKRASPSSVVSINENV